MKRIFLLAGLLLFVVNAAAWTQTVIVSWDANPEQDVTHYTVYWRVLSSDDNPINTCTSTTTNAIVGGLVPGLTYVFYVTASNSSMESDPSDSVTWLAYMPKPQPPTSLFLQ